MNTFSKRLFASATGYAFVAGAVFGAAGTGIGATVLGSSVFDDVERGSYYDAAIGEMYSDGVIKGYDGTDNFGPNDYVTRGQVAVMLQRFKDEVNGGDDDDDDSSSSRSRSSSSSSSSSTSSSNNPRGTLRFATTGFSISENQSKATISVVRVGGSQGEVSVKYEAKEGTATDGEDFEEASGTIVFEDDETSQTFNVTLKDDSSSESDETIVLTLSSPEDGASLGSPSTLTITLKDNESSNGSSSSASAGATSSNPKGSLSFAASTYMVNETNGTMTVTVVRTGGSSSAVAVNYATSNGSGQSNIDYTATNGTLNFAAGETSKTFTVGILDDSSIGGNATFNLTLSSVTGGASLGSPSTAVVSIFDNENTGSTFGSGSLKFSKATYDAYESDQQVQITVQRVGGANGTVTVNYATTNGTAMSGADYTAMSGTMTFTHGETAKILTIPIVKDTNAENGDEFFINLSSPSSNATIVSPNSATVTISS